MSAATKDLPDPLDPMPTMSVSNPDDLLAQMADEAIDRLMADADMGALPSGPPVPMEQVAPGEPDAMTLAGEAAPAPVAPFIAAEPAGKADVGSASTIDSATAEAASVTADPVVPGASPAETPAETLAAASVAVAPAATPERQALLGDAAPHASRPSILLWPLRVINAPFAGIGDDGRRLIGLLAIVSLVPTACAFVYLYWLKHH